MMPLGRPVIRLQSFQAIFELALVRCICGLNEFGQGRCTLIVPVDSLLFDL